MKRILQSLCIAMLLPIGAVLAQPANDNCSTAATLDWSSDPLNLTLVNGDTRNATGDLGVPDVCSGSWFQDDVWYDVTLPGDLPEDGVVIQCFFGTEADDVLAVGMAIYETCDSSAAPLTCFSSSDPADNNLTLSSLCLTPGGTYKVRVWSGGSPTDNSGTFRIAAFPNTETDNVLWLETFADSLDGGWTTFGECSVADSNANAQWRYDPDGLLDQGAYIFAGFGINSLTKCDGAVGVDSDFDDTDGIEGNFGGGRCPAPGQYILVSPALATAEWGVAGVSVTWTQAIRQFQSTFFVSFRTYMDGAWGDWRDFAINEAFETNANAVSADVQRLFLGGATDGDSLQLRWVYNANFYMWGIDDIKLVETEAHNMRSMSNWYAIAPAAVTPYTQSASWYPQNDVYNAGAVEQTNVVLNFTVMDSEGTEVYNDNVEYGTMAPDTLVENVNFPTPVQVPLDRVDTYEGYYIVESDSATLDTDFDPSDNVNMVAFQTSMNEYALETGFTRSIAVNDAIYDEGAPLSYTYGNYMYFPRGGDYDLTAKSVVWGVANPDEVAGIDFNVFLFKWTDLNENQIAEAAEREFKGIGTHVFAGDEGDNVIVETELTGFNGPDDLDLENGGEYLVMVEYNANDDVTFCFMLASEERDYGSVVLSAEQAGIPTYASVLGFSPDGIIAGIDYEVTELDPEDDRIYFGWDVVPLVRLLLDGETNTNEVLAEENVISMFPNPASDMTTVRFDLVDVMDEVQMQVIDASGRVMENRVLDGVQNDTYELNVSNYANGAYFLNIQTDAGSRSMRFVVQH